MHVPIWKTHGRYRKQMKRGYTKLLYNQRNKDETIISVIKRLFGDYISSRLVRTQNRELLFRCIAYNTHRLTNLVIIVMVSTKPTKKRAITNMYHIFANQIREANTNQTFAAFASSQAGNAIATAFVSL
jgi:hypothetical protein